MRKEREKMRYIKQNAKGGIKERSILNDKKRRKKYEEESMREIIQTIKIKKRKIEERKNMNI